MKLAYAPTGASSSARTPADDQRRPAPQAGAGQHAQAGDRQHHHQVQPQHVDHAEREVQPQPDHHDALQRQHGQDDRAAERQPRRRASRRAPAHATTARTSTMSNAHDSANGTFE